MSIINFNPTSSIDVDMESLGRLAPPAPGGLPKLPNSASQSLAQAESVRRLAQSVADEARAENRKYVREFLSARQWEIHCDSLKTPRHELLPYQLRVVEQKKWVDDHLESLGKFINFKSDSVYTSLSSVERDDLYKQRTAMEQYSQLLGSRISRF